MLDQNEVRKYSNKDFAIDILGVIAFLVNMAIIAPIFFAFFGKQKKFSKGSHFITLELWDHLATYLIFILTLISNNALVLNILSLIASILLLHIVFKILTVSLNPHGLLEVLVEKFFQNENAMYDFTRSLVLERENKAEIDAELRAAFKKGEEADSSDRFSLSTIAVVTFAKVFVKLSSSPKIPLFMFLCSYFLALLQTALLLAVLCKGLIYLGVDLNGFKLFSIGLLSISGSFSSELIEASGKYVLLYMAFTNLLSFFYLVIAILAFGSILGRSSENFQQKIIKIYEKQTEKMSHKISDLLWESVEHEKNVNNKKSDQSSDYKKE